MKMGQLHLLRRATMWGLLMAWLAGMIALSGGVEAAVRIVRQPGGAAAPAGGAAAKGIIAGVHLEGTTNITNWNYRMQDGGSYVWDLTQQGSIGQGSNYCFAQAFYLTVNNNGFSSGGGRVNKAGDEAEMGPYQMNQLRVSRRFKVYKDRPLARFLDIFENPTAADMQVPVQINMNTNWTIQKITTSSEQSAWGEKDYALTIETPNGGMPMPPSSCHILTDKRSKLRPTVQIQNNQMYVRWTITVPAGGTAILAYFASQNSSLDEQVKLMKTFAAPKMLRDIPPAVRRLIVNFSAGGGFEDFDLDRTADSDGVVLAGGDPLFGTIQNKSFAVETSFGQLNLPAEQVIGFAASAKSDGAARFLMKDGQIIGGRTSEKLQLQLAPGGVLSIPLDQVRQWSYRITPGRPEEITSSGAFLMLRTGDRLTFDPQATPLKFRTRNGDVDLQAKDLARIVMDNSGNGVHRAMFTNGSTLGGFLEPQKLPVALKIGQKLDISRDLLSEVQFNVELATPPPLSLLTLSNGDQLLGTLSEEKISVRTDYGMVEVAPQNLKNLTFSNGNHNRAIIDLWDGSKGVHGDLEQLELAFQVRPGPLLHVPAGQIVSLVTPFAMPPDNIRKDVMKLVDQLGSENWKDRQKATDELLRMKAGIVPLLRERMNDGDAEIRQRLQDIIERMGPPGATSPKPAAVRSSPQLLIGG